MGPGRFILVDRHSADLLNAAVASGSASVLLSVFLDFPVLAGSLRKTRDPGGKSSLRTCLGTENGACSIGLPLLIISNRETDVSSNDPSGR